VKSRRHKCGIDNKNDAFNNQQLELSASKSQILPPFHATKVILFIIVVDPLFISSVFL
jgi:hypothetical protein